MRFSWNLGSRTLIGFSSLAVCLLYFYIGVNLHETTNPNSLLESTHHLRPQISFTLSKQLHTIQRLPQPSQASVSSKWAVITTIHYPTNAVKKLANLPGWKVVVVGDLKTPQDWSYPNCIFLSVKKQEELGYRTMEVLPFNHYGRKNIGYLYAIQHGAKIIYEADDDNELIGDTLNIMSPVNNRFDNLWVHDMLIYNTKEKVVNPYEHFGQSTVWPRGYPIQHVSKATTHKFFKAQSTDHVNPIIQQGLANGDPDVDSVFRMTRKTYGTKMDIRFDSQAPPVAIPRGTMVPFNSQNTVFLYPSLWAMLIPITTTFRVCDIWRSYWAQRLLWEVRGNIAFLPPTVEQFRNIHDYFEDYLDERDIFSEAERLINFLIKWRPSSIHFFDKVLELSSAMEQEGFWEYKDVLLTQAWIQDLVAVGYELPPHYQSTPHWDPQEELGPLEEVVVTPKELPSNRLKFNKKEFLYLIQTESDIDPSWRKRLISESSDVKVLSFKTKTEGNLYVPQTTWSTGRNVLFHEGIRNEQEQGWQYRYFIFMDDDISLETKDPNDTREPYRIFEQFLLEWEPAVGTAHYAQGHTHITATTGVHATYHWDHCFVAFHREAIHHILPYNIAYENKKSSWYTAPFMSTHEGALWNRGHVLELMDLVVRNPSGRNYPKGFEKGPLGHSFEAAQLHFLDSLPSCMKGCFDWLDNNSGREWGEALKKNGTYNFIHNCYPPPYECPPCDLTNVPRC